MSRLIYDSRKYYEEKAKLPKPDGIRCIICGELFKIPDNRRLYCSQKCFAGWYNSVINSWSELRERIIKRDGKCLECGIECSQKTNTSFEVHHKKPICDGGDEFNPDNCITLCYNCHKNKHTIIGKKKRLNRSLEDFSENIDNGCFPIA